MDMSMSNRKHFTKSQVKERGWTETMIRSFLPEPDETKTNPRYKNAPPMKLFLKERVIEIEATKPFMKMVISSERRKKISKEAAKKTVETKKQRLLEAVEAIEITVPTVDIDVLRRRAISDHNERQSDSGRFDSFASEDSMPDFLARIMVNYLRHEMTDYERELHKIEGKTGKNEACIKLKERYLKKIGEKYPGLIAECDRQAVQTSDQDI